MQFDVATFNSLCLLTFLCGTIVAAALSRMFEHVTAFRFWALGFFLITLASTCFALHAVWHADALLLATATLGLQSRILIWSGTRELFGAPALLRFGYVASAVFCALYAAALFLKVPPVYRVVLWTLFFFPFRALTLYEICRRRRPDLGLARMLVTIAAALVTLNTAVPIALVALNRANLALLFGDPRTTSAVYAVVFFGDLLLASSLIVMALQHVIVEQNILATLDRSETDRAAAAWARRHDTRGAHAAPVRADTV